MLLGTIGPSIDLKEAIEISTSFGSEGGIDLQEARRYLCKSAVSIV